MQTQSVEYQFVPGVGPEPESAEGRTLFASLLPGPVSRWTMSSFHYSMPEGEQPIHCHSSDVALCVLQGAITFGFGDGFTDRVRVKAGDYIMIRANVPHAEIIEPGGVHGVIAHVGHFSTISVGVASP